MILIHAKPLEIAEAIYDLNLIYLEHARREEVKLLVGTCAVESGFRYRIQSGTGPARGIMQIEPDTARDLLGRFLPVHRKILRARLMGIVFDITDSARFFYPEDADLLAALLTVYDDLSILLARTKYLTDPRPIPVKVEDQAVYWKRVYNTASGAGTVAMYRKAWTRYGCGRVVDEVFRRKE